MWWSLGGVGRGEAALEAVNDLARRSRNSGIQLRRERNLRVPAMGSGGQSSSNETSPNVVERVDQRCCERCDGVAGHVDHSPSHVGRESDVGQPCERQDYGRQRQTSADRQCGSSGIPGLRPPEPTPTLPLLAYPGPITVKPS